MSHEKCDQTGLEHRPDLETETETEKNISHAGQEIKSSSYKQSVSKNTERKKQKFLTALIPAAGQGCHPALLGVANLGVSAGLDDAEIFKHLRSKTPPGSRIVPDEEIWQAIAKARDQPAPTLRRTLKRQLPVVHKLKKKEVAQAALQAIIAKGGGGISCADLVKTSPVPIDGSEYDIILLLKNLYSPDDLVFIGRRGDPGIIGDTIRTTAEWIIFFQNEYLRTAKFPEALCWSHEQFFSDSFPHIMANPLSGLLGKTKSGKDTYRGDACVKAFRFAVGEFDNLPVEAQLAFWKGLGLPLCAVIHSGSRSIHAWVRADGVKDAASWERVIEGGLFPILTDLGCDPACKNESRLSRLPGIYRPEKNQWQRLLWLCPDGGVL
jgi:hypothetical protein